MPEQDAYDDPPFGPDAKGAEDWPLLQGFPTHLVLVSTPIGNLGDVTSRAIAVLKSADLVLCEDSRVTGRLLFALGLRAKLESLHDHNEEGRIPALLAAARAGRRLALVSDAGTPLVSDPGYRLVRAFAAEGLRVTALPGANAAVTALTLSGLPPQPFLFLGFPPPKSAARRAAFASLRAAEGAGLAATIIWYEAPHRVLETLDDLLVIFGERPAALARELTKHFEEVRRGTLGDLRASVEADPPRGEICLLLGPGSSETTPETDLDSLLRAALAQARLREAVAQVAAETGLPRRQVYARALALSEDKT